MSTPTIEVPSANSAPAISLRAPLNSLDRCDSCGAQAYVAATVSGSELLYCGHHATKFEPKLKSIASSWHDERSKLLLDG